jgi:hypothetical protein
VSLCARFAPLLLAGAFAARAQGQQAVVLRDPGPGPVPRHLAAALRAPHRLIPPGTTRAELPRDSSYASTVIVLHRDATIAGHVHGDVIVVGGDAFMHPGAIVDGRVIAIGGGVYASQLAVVRGGSESHRDFTYDLQPMSSGYALNYRVVREHPSPIFSLPGIYGLRIPTYDRVDGLSVPAGPSFTLETAALIIDPTITYRSNLGAFDPAVHSDLQFGRLTRAELFAGRTTLTNDDWIWSDLLNSAAVLAVGLDTRNYYRADRVQGTLHHLFEGTHTSFEPYFGVRAERDRPVGSATFGGSRPWSLFGRQSEERLLRPNPQATRGTLIAGLVGAHVEWEAQNVRVGVDVLNEAAAFEIGSRRFDQTTFDGSIEFPTFGAQQFRFASHVLHTFGDRAPPQRGSYLGGSGTLTTLPLLSLGGDQLLYVESDYVIPFNRFDLPYLGAPSFTLRHMIGSAGVGELPPFRQNLGMRFALSFLRFDAVVDPARRSWEFGFGLTMAR